MDPNVTIVDMFNSFLEAGGSPKVTSFKKHLDQLINANVKHLCNGRGKGPGHTSNMGDDWRKDQKANFAGRGAKWIKRSLDQIELTLQRFEKDGIDCSDYRAWTTQAGYAWVRYSGPRVENGVAMAAFEVRTGGSKHDHPKQTYRMYNLDMMDHIEMLGGTPHSMELEVIKEVVSEDTEEQGTEAVTLNDVVIGEVVKEEEEVLELSGYELNPYDDGGSAWAEESDDDNEEAVNEAPTSDDPEEWEAFLTAEGLGMDQLDDDDTENLYGEF